MQRQLIWKKIVKIEDLFKNLENLVMSLDKSVQPIIEMNLKLEDDLSLEVERF